MQCTNCGGFNTYQETIKAHWLMVTCEDCGQTEQRDVDYGAMVEEAEYTYSER